MRYNNNTSPRIKQGIFYNTDFRRWEYYGIAPVVRAGEPMPDYVSADYQKCADYKKAVNVQDEMSV